MLHSKVKTHGQCVGRNLELRFVPEENLPRLEVEVLALAVYFVAMLYSWRPRWGKLKLTLRMAAYMMRNSE